MAALAGGAVTLKAGGMGMSGLKTAGSLAGNIGSGTGKVFNAYKAGGMAGVGNLIRGSGSGSKNSALNVAKAASHVNEKN